MGLFLAFIASVFISASNYFMRRSIDAGGTVKIFLIVQMCVGFLVALLMGPITSNAFGISFPIACLGIGTGFLLAVMLFFLGKALETGPAGFTFSIVSAATVVPGIIMAMVFGATLGFNYTFWHGIGSIFVLLGIFWGGRGLTGIQNRFKWTSFLVTIFSLHVLILVIYQWRAVLMNLPNPEDYASFFTAEQMKSLWFNPMLYFGTALGLFVLYFKEGFRLPQKEEWSFGIVGGILHSTSTFFLIKGTEIATGMENVIIFPLFSVGIIVLSNLWSQKLYQEKINWRACQVCAFGILIGTVDWKIVANLIGW